MTTCRYCTKEYIKRENKHHEEGCFDFYKYQNKELEKKVTNSDRKIVNLEKNVETLTRQNNELRENETILKNNLRMSENMLKLKIEKFWDDSSVPGSSATIVPNISVPETASPLNVYQYLKSRIGSRQMIRESGQKIKHHLMKSVGNILCKNENSNLCPF